MRPLKVPESARKAFVALARLEEHQFEELAQTIRSTRPQFSKSEYLEDVLSKMKSIEETSARIITNELFSVEYLRNEEEDKSGRVVVESILKSMSGEDVDGVPFTDDDEQALKTRLNKLIDSWQSLGLTAKSSNIVTDQDKVFIKSRVLTDFRPIFNDEASSVDAGVVVHTLSIHFSQNMEHRDFYVALDQNDIRDLMKQLERAENKAAVLHGLIAKSGVPQLKPRKQ